MNPFYVNALLIPKLITNSFNVVLKKKLNLNKSDNLNKKSSLLLINNDILYKFLKLLNETTKFIKLF